MPKQKILIVEDDLASLKLYCTMIESGGYQPLPATNAKHAIDIFKNEKPQLIIGDLSLPDISGMQLIHCLRQMPEGEAIPVIIISGYSGRIESAKHSHENIAAFLTKPVDSATFSGPCCLYWRWVFFYILQSIIKIRGKSFHFQSMAAV